MDESLEKTPQRYWRYTKKQWITIITVLVISLAARIPKIDYPNVVVFDETHFGGFLSDYIRGVCFFDIHPPLGKLMLAGVARLTGYKGDFNFSIYENTYTSNFYVPIRLVPAILSSFIGPLITASLFLRNVNSAFAFLGGLLFALDFTGITQCRFILTDGILYFLVALTIFFTCLYEQTGSLLVFYLQAFSAALSFNVKFTAYGVYFYIAVSHLRLLYKRDKNWFLALVARGIVISLILFATLYFFVSLHMYLLPIEGFGDRYMERGFRQLPQPVRVVKMVWAMYSYNANLKFTHPYQTKWYQWPTFTAPPLLIWEKGNSHIAIFNNPVSAIGSAIGFILCLFTKKFEFAVGYAFSLFGFIAVSRCTWSYHYSISLIFGIIALSENLHYLLQADNRKILAVALCVVTVVVYLFWMPLIYGIPVSRSYAASMLPWHYHFG